MVVIILVSIPLTIPKLFSFQLYSVLTKSMTPLYPVGSVIYVQEASPQDIVVGDVITFEMGENINYTTTHRVVEINKENQYFVTKGDTNNAQDVDPVSFSRLIGTPKLCIPYLGELSNKINSTSGQILSLLIFIISITCWVGAEIINKYHVKNEFHVDKKIYKENDKNYIKLIIRWLAIVIVIYSMFSVGKIIWGYLSSENEYNDLKVLVYKSGELDNSQNDSLNLNIDFDTLLEANSDTIGWITFKESVINYPVMQTDNNDYYLTNTFNRNKNATGSIFMETMNNKNFNDYHTIIYGHNMRNDSMFGTLEKYSDESYYDGNEYFYITTLDEERKYQIFSMYTVVVPNPLYTIGFEADETYVDFIETLQRDSLYDTGVDIDKNDKIITLSTCGDSDEVRFVVHGKLITAE